MASSMFGCRAARRFLVAAAAVVPLSVLPTAGRDGRAGAERLRQPHEQHVRRSCSNACGVDGVRAHQAALQAIADENGGTRAAGTPGYTGSVDYVVDTLEAAGWNVTLDEFPFTFIPPADAAAADAGGRDVRDRRVHRDSGSATVTGNVIPVDINLVPPRDPVTSGCEAADFAGSTSAARPTLP